MKEIILIYLEERIQELEDDWEGNNNDRLSELTDLKERIENLKL